MSGTVLDYYRSELKRIPETITRSTYRDFLIQQIRELHAARKEGPHDDNR